MIILTSGKPSCSPHHCQTIRTAGGTQIYVEVQLSVFRGSLLIGEHKEIVLSDSNVFNDWRGDSWWLLASLCCQQAFPRQWRQGLHLTDTQHFSRTSDFSLEKLGEKQLKWPDSKHGPILCCLICLLTKIREFPFSSKFYLAAFVLSCLDVSLSPDAWNLF